VGSTFEDLKQLSEMLERGEITKAEFETVKAELLAEATGDQPVTSHPTGRHGASPEQDVPRASSDTSESIAAVRSTASSPTPKTQWYQRKGVWLVGAVVVLIALANSLNSGTSQTPSATNPAPSDGQVSNATMSCGTYASAMADLSNEVSDLLTRTSSTANDVAAGSISMSSGASIMTASASEISRIKRDLAQMGDPPSTLAPAITLFRRALDRFESSFTKAAQGMNSGDLGLVNEATDLLLEGSSLITDATDLIQPCP
jgi:hypothetical protein